jgi:hypothetical protein
MKKVFSFKGKNYKTQSGMLSAQRAAVEKIREELIFSAYRFLISGPRHLKSGPAMATVSRFIGHSIKNRLGHIDQRYFDAIIEDLKWLVLDWVRENKRKATERREARQRWEEKEQKRLAEIERKRRKNKSAARAAWNSI